MIDKSFWVGVASSILATWLLWFAARILNIRIPTPSRWFWHRLVKDAHVVISQVNQAYDIELRTGMQPPLTPIGDAIALAELSLFTRTQLRGTLTLDYIFDVADWNRIKAKNLIIIGGPKYNDACTEALLKIDRTIPYQFARIRVSKEQWRLDDIEFKKFVGQAENADRDSHLKVTCLDTSDFSTVLWLRNPYDQRKQILLVGGLSTLSTTAAMRWLLRQRGWSWLWYWLKYDGFQVLLSCEVVDPITVTKEHVERLEGFEL